MAKVTLYQQGQLASSQVGTPGVYNAAAQTLGVIGQGAQGVANEVYTTGNMLFQSVIQQRREKEAELKAYNKALKNAEQDAYINERLEAAEAEYVNIYTGIRETHRNNTSGAMADFNQQAQQIRQQFLENESDPLIKAKLRSGFAGKIQQYSANIDKWAQERQVPIMEQNVQKTAGSFSLVASNSQLPAGEIGQKAQEYFQQNAKNYEFIYGSEASVKMREDVATGVKNYLAATALNNPELLEDRIAAFSGGSLIDPTDLNRFAGEQRRIAAEIKSANAAAEKQDKMSNQLQAMERLIDATPTGDPKDADPRVIAEIKKEFGSKLTNEQNVRLSELEKQATQKQIKTLKEEERLQDERSIAKNYGNLASMEMKLAAQIDDKITRIGKLKGEDRLRAVADLQIDVDRYQDTYTSLNALKNSIKNKDLKGITGLQLLSAKERFGDIMTKLGRNEQAKQTRSMVNNLYAKVQPPSMFPDARKQTMYATLWQSVFYDQIQQRNWSPEKMRQAIGNQSVVNALRNTLKKDVDGRMRTLGWLE